MDYGSLDFLSLVLFGVKKGDKLEVLEREKASVEGVCSTTRQVNWEVGMGVGELAWHGRENGSGWFRVA